MTLDEAARNFLGVPFRHQGRNPAIGIDCIGLLVVSATACGISLTDCTAYGRDPAHGLLESHLEAACGPMLPVSSIAVGDIAAVSFAGAVRHVGIVAAHPEGLSLIHTNSSVGRVTEARIDAKWLKRIAGVYRLER